MKQGKKKKKESTGYVNSLKLKNSGVNQSWNNVMLQNAFVLRGGGEGRGGSDGRRREEGQFVFFSARLGLEIKMQKSGPLCVCGVCVCVCVCVGEDVCAPTTPYFSYLVIDRRQSHSDLSSLIALCG